jgi:hypothetical protein
VDLHIFFPPKILPGCTKYMNENRGGIAKVMYKYYALPLLINNFTSIVAFFTYFHRNESVFVGTEYNRALNFTHGNLHDY